MRIAETWVGFCPGRAFKANMAVTSCIALHCLLALVFIAVFIVGALIGPKKLHPDKTQLSPFEKSMMSRSEVDVLGEQNSSSVTPDSQDFEEREKWLNSTPEPSDE